MLRIKFGHFAMIFGITGIALLYVVTVLSQPVTVSDFTHLGEFQGETVSVEGTVLSSKIIQNGEVVYTIYNNGEMLDILTEFGSDTDQSIKVNNIVTVTGEVQKDFKGDLQLVVSDPSSLKVKGIYFPPEFDWADPAPFNNTYVVMRGTVTRIDNYYDDYQEITLRNGSKKVILTIQDPAVSLKTGNVVSASGIVTASPDDLKAKIYSSGAVEVLGQWEVQTAGLDELMSGPERYLDFPAYIKGVVRYEPYSDPAYSFYLSDSALDSSISIKVELNKLTDQPVLHKGDTVSMIACTRYDLSAMRYVLEPVDLEIVHRLGTWRISLDELAENFIEYERARINLSAYLHHTGNHYVLGNRAVLENCSIMLKVQPENINRSIADLKPYDKHQMGTPVSITGTADARPGSFEYIFTLKAEPDSYFKGSPVLD